MATLSVRTLWQGLEMLGYEPGPATDEWNNTIKRAATLWARDRIAGGNPTVIDPIGVAPARNVEVVPDSSADFIRHQAASYTDPEVAERAAARARTSTSSPSAITPASSAPLAVPFFRANNPWAWALFLVPTAGLLGWLGWRYLPRSRSRRS